MIPQMFSPDWLAEVAIKSSLPILAVWVLVLIFRRLSAARRHAIWMTGILAAATIPLFSLAVPKWHSEWVPDIRIDVRFDSPPASAGNLSVNLPIPIAGAEKTAPLAMSAQRPKRQISWRFVIWTLLLAGGGIQVCWQSLAFIRLRRIRRQSHAVSGGFLERLLPEYPLEVRATSAISIPMLSGVRRPVVLLPDHCTSWPPSTLRAVLLHELAHFERRDHLVLPVLGVVRIVYWWHPAIGFALSRLRSERERACDDLVVDRGLPPSAYSEALMEVVRCAASRPLGELAMARKSRLRERIEAILDGGRSRRRTGAWLGGGLAAAAVLTALFVGSLASQPETAASRSEIEKSSTKESRRPDLPPIDPRVPVEVRMTTLLFRIPSQIQEMHRKEIEEAVAQGRPDLLANVDGVSLLAAPSMVIRSGARFRGVDAREYRYPTDFEVTPVSNVKGTGIDRVPLTPTSFESTNIGIEIEGGAAVVKNGIRLNGQCVICQIDGFVDGDPEAPSPSFQTREISFLRTIGNGEFVGLWVPGDWIDSTEMTRKAMSPDAFVEGRPAQWTEAVPQQVRLALFLSAKVMPTGRPDLPARSDEFVATKKRLGVRAYDVTAAPWSESIRGQLRLIEGVGPYQLFAKALRDADLAGAKPLPVKDSAIYSRFVTPDDADCMVSERPTRKDEPEEFAVLFSRSSGVSKPIIVRPTGDARYRLFVSNVDDPESRRAVLLEFYDK